MKPTSLPNARRTVTGARRQTHVPHRASRHALTHRRVVQAELRMRRTRDLRGQVAAAFRDLAHGVDASSAQEQTRNFYRSGGQDWSRALAERSDHGFRARVAEAFRVTARGVDEMTARARTLRFYRSSGQRWAQNLG